MSRLDEEALLQKSTLFDAEWYQACYPDVRYAGMTPEQHFLKYGWRLGRDPGPRFSTAAYLQRHDDVRRADVNPLLHYLRNGESEGRRIDAASEVPRIFLKAAAPSLPSQKLRQIPQDREGQLTLQLEDTQQLLEYYFRRCQELQSQHLDH
ncbi:hypothetical protein [Halomonas elongata]|uniref:hypothetical protein n=1 Tax=Halomonas elongata TaxID=2746 RepID=UPI00186B5BA3|nr:hypothetical protein [Halomonas elongata]MBW5798982.1 hypothetical protein [Halomonas elongata]